MYANLESSVFSIAAKALRQAFPGLFIISEYTASPAKFPAVLIVEMENTVYQKMSTTRLENASKVMYQVDIYTNDVGHKKETAKKIMEIIDFAFGVQMGFMRIMCSPIQNMLDATIYHMVARYEGVADEGFMIFAE